MTEQTDKQKSGFIYIPTANIYFAKQRTHLGKNWNKTHELLKSEGLRMPTIEEFRKTLAYLKNSNEQKIYNEITGMRNPLRANWIDAYFEQRKDGLYVLTGNKTKAEKLEDWLKDNKTPGINIEQWIEGKNVTSQGLPKPQINSGGLYYWYPFTDRVVKFVAVSGGTFLDCSKYPSYGTSELGVFGVMDADANGNAYQNAGGIK